MLRSFLSRGIFGDMNFEPTNRADEAVTVVPMSAQRRRKTSALSSGNRPFVADGDGRTVWALRWRDLVHAHLTDLGGEEIASAAQVALARRAATLEIELERQEATLSAGGKIDLDAFNRASGGLRRILETLGVERKARPVNAPLTLQEISARIKAERQSEGRL